jgi:hypothetical protein
MTDFPSLERPGGSFMRSVSRAAGAALLLLVAALVAAIGVAPMLVAGADHLDAPTVKTDKRIDITDIYAFRSGPGRTTVAINVNPLLSPAATETAHFRPSALYELKVDTNGDAVADIAYRFRFGKVAERDDDSDQTVQVRRATGAAAARTEWSGKVVANGRTTEADDDPVVTGLAGGGRLFAGPRDDPFFFDLAGFVQFKQRLLAGSTDLGELLGGFTGTDTFAGTNISAIVLELPTSKLGPTGSTVGIWATTAIRQDNRWVQVERMARPAINTVFNHTDADKDTANRISPTDDRAFDRDNVLGVLDAIGDVLDANGLDRYDAATEAAIADLLLPDVLTIELGNAGGFLNGRRLADDVIDAELGVLTNGNVTSDGVDANDRGFPAAFPYLAAPHE